MKSIRRILVKFSGLLGLFGLSACSNQTAPAVSRPREELVDRLAAAAEPSVLFVGNSYSFGVPREFSRLAAARGKKIRTGHSTYGGWTLARHAANEATLNKIRSGKWDAVVFQEQSEIPAMPARKRRALMDQPLRKLVAEARGQGAVPVLYQTWGRREGDAKLRNDDFHAMTARLREGYREAAESCGGVVVVPAGDAWEREVNAGRGADLFMADGSHPTPLGNQVTAGAFAEAFFGK